MATFKKPILSVGKYRVTTPNGPKEEKFTVSRLRKHAKVANAMLKDGINIPAPFEHAKDAVPVKSTTATHSFLNGGFWKRFWVSDEDGKPTLYGEVEAPGDVTDFSTPAGKIGQTVKETSICLVPEFIDGDSKKWEDPIMHVALVTHPIEKGQRNFELLDNSTVVAMSMSMDKSDDVDTNPGTNQVTNDGGYGQIPALREKLKNVCKLYLPDDTTPETLVSNLLVAVNQYELCEMDEEDDTQIVQAPTYMSKDNEMPMTEDQAKAIVASGAVNPATNKPFTMEDLGLQRVAKETPKPTSPVGEADAKLIAFTKALAKKFLDDKKEALAKRIETLVKSNRVAKEFADKNLVPQVAAIQMSFDNGEIAKSSVELTIEALESLPAQKVTMSNNLPEGAQEILSDLDTDVQVDDKLMEEIADFMVNSL